MAIAPSTARAKPAEGGPTTRVTWLTLASLLAAALQLTLSPKLDVLPHYSASVEGLKQVLNYPDDSNLFNGLRAGLAADMVFLLAYGALLRASVLWHEGRRIVTWAANLCLLLMVVDFVENAATLHLLSSMELSRPATWGAVRVMNGASIAKWLLAAVISGTLARLWWGTWSRVEGLQRLAYWLIAVSFALGATASLATAAAFFVPTWATTAAFAAFVFPALALVLQAFALGLPGKLARFLVLARAPLGALLILIAFGPLAVGPVRSLLGGILVLDSEIQLGVLTACTLLAALACGAQINVFSCYAADRMPDTTSDRFASPTLRDVTFHSCLAAGLVLPVSAFTASDELSIAKGLVMMVVAVLVTLASFVGVEFLVAWAANPATVKDTPFFVTPSLSEGLAHALDRAKSRARPAMVSAFSNLTTSLSHWLHQLLGGPGYFAESGGRYHLLPGITLATVSFLFTAAVYATVVLAKLFTDSGSGDVRVPTATAIVLLLLMVSWILASVTYYLDRYRVPLFSALVGLALVTGARPATDHVFEVRPTEGRYRERTPAEVLGVFTDRPILVAIAGGGIQAGAWGTEVLAELDTKVLSGSLRSRVALVSAVSGGAMGALYYGAHFDAGPARARAEAIKPSLDQVATTLVGADVWRLAGGVPFVAQTFDRGRALERSWEARMQDGAPPVAGGPTVRDWAALAGTPRTAGRFPAFVFNTTVVETGQPVAIATTAMPSPALVDELKGQLSQTPVVQHFNTLYGLADAEQGPRDAHLSMATAARLSSTFPYVSPAAAPAWPATGPWSALPRYHLVDGGYYDNFGLFALAQWLDDALTDMTKRGQRLPLSVEVVVIRGETDDGPAPGVTTGWATQLSAPASAFVATRSYGQWAGGSAALKLLKDKWKAKTAICDVAFPYPVQELRQELPVCADTPLSWKLTEANTRCLSAAWKHSAKAVEALRRIEAAVAQGTQSCAAADAGDDAAR